MSIKINMARIPSGTFMMGNSYVNDPKLSDKVNVFYHNEQPVHQVTLDGFQIGTTPVTQTQYKAVTGENPSTFSDESDAPVTNVSAAEAMRFCNKLSVDEGLKACYDDKTLKCDYSLNGYRLPTEAEWEYACKAGTDTLFYTGNSESDLDSAGWHLGNSGERTQKVAQKKPNSYGLFDMHGNVGELCSDGWQGEFCMLDYSAKPVKNPRMFGRFNMNILRGGSWFSEACDCRSTVRACFWGGGGNYYIGFRVVRKA